MEPKYLGHMVLDSTLGRSAVCIYVTSSKEDLLPNELVDIPPEFNHAEEGEESRFQYLNWFMVNPQYNRWGVSDYSILGKLAVELHSMPVPGLASEMQISQDMRMLFQVARMASFDRMALVLRSPKDHPFSDSVPNDVSLLPDPVAREVYDEHYSKIIVPDKKLTVLRGGGK